MVKRFFRILILFLVISQTFIAQESRYYLLKDGGNKVGVISKDGTDFGFFMPETGGYFLSGIMTGGKGLWLKDADKVKIDKKDKGWTVSVSDKMLGKGQMLLHVLPLSACNGMIIEVSGKNLPEDLKFVWSYGGCSALDLDAEKKEFLKPEQCLNNVFSREINSFTVYFGPNNKLKVMMGVAPLDTETRLSDANKMSDPLQLWESGKKTDAPVMTAANAIKSGEKYYYCIYRQNQDADYNYYMLPELFKKELTTKNDKKNEEATPHPGFGPDFHF
jgi:hypothetical protein